MFLQYLSRAFSIFLPYFYTKISVFMHIFAYKGTTILLIMQTKLHKNRNFHLLNCTKVAKITIYARGINGDFRFYRMLKTS